jgi:hypothetical protein
MPCFRTQLAARYGPMRGVVVFLLTILVVGCGKEPLITAFPQGDHAAACDRSREIESTQFDATDRHQLVTKLLCWVEQNSSYKELRPPRGLVELDIRVIWDMGWRNGYPMYAAQALYKCSDQTIYLVQGRDYRQLQSQSTLVHELVHHAQCLRHSVALTRHEQCDREREAYAIQAKFIRFIGETVKRSDEEKANLLRAADLTEKNSERACSMIGTVRWPSRPAQ